MGTRHIISQKEQIFGKVDTESKYFFSKLLKNSPVFFLNSDAILNSLKKLHLIRSNFINNKWLWFQLVSVSSDGKMLVWKMDRKTKQIELHDGYEFFLRFLSDL